MRIVLLVVVAVVLASCNTGPQPRVCYVPSLPDGGCLIIDSPNLASCAGQVLTPDQAQSLPSTCAQEQQATD